MVWKRAIVGIALLAMCVPAWADAPETWTLAFKSNLNMTNPAGAGVTTESSGSAQITSDADGKFTGSGTITATVIYNLKVPGVSVKNPTGKGTFTVKGHREGTNLVFAVGGPAVQCKGAMTITSPVGSETSPFDTTFDPATVAPTENNMIARKNGATTTIDLSIAGNSTLTGASTFTLTGSNPEVKEEPVVGDFPAPPNPWTLELDLKLDTVVSTGKIEGSSTFTQTGKAEFPMPYGDGTARGQGPLNASSSSKFVKPMPAQSSDKFKGVLYLEGTIKDGVLSFYPRVKLETLGGQASPSNVTTNAAFGQGFDWWDPQDKPTIIPVENDAELVVPVSVSMAGSTTTGSLTWRLRGKKIERWRATVDQWLNIVYGSFGNLNSERVGLRVHWRRVIDFEVEDGKYKSGSGKNKIIACLPFSDPAGLCDCKPVVSSIIGTGTDIEGERWDQVRNAKKFNPKFMTPEAAKLKALWEKIDKHKTPYTFPTAYSVSGSVSGGQATLDMPDPCGFTVAYHCVPAEKGKLYETVNDDRYTVGKNVIVTLSDGWTNSRDFNTIYQGAYGWKESSGGNNPGNSENITVTRVK